MRLWPILMVAPLLLAGCTIVQEPRVKEIAGPTDGYTPTGTYLKVHLKRTDGSSALLNFDRRDWHVSRIAQMLDQKEVPFVSAQAMPRDILNEYVAQSVADPGEIAKLRFDDMGANAQQRADMDAEYEALLERYVGERAPVVIPPTALLPMDPLP